MLWCSPIVLVLLLVLEVIEGLATDGTYETNETYVILSIAVWGR